MPKFIVNTNFQFFGIVRRADSTIEVSEDLLEKEIALGTKEVTSKNGNVTVRPLSGLLNHCQPADKETAALVDGIGKEAKPAGPSEDETAARIAEIHDALDKIGKAYDKRWGLKKLEEELIKAHRTTGE